MNIVLMIIFESSKQQMSVVSALFEFCQLLAVNSYNPEKLCQRRARTFQTSWHFLQWSGGVVRHLWSPKAMECPPLGRSSVCHGTLPSLPWLLCQQRATPFVSSQPLVRSGCFAPRRLLSGSEQHMYLINSKITLASRQIIYSVLIYSCERPKFIIIKCSQETLHIEY